MAGRRNKYKKIEKVLAKTPGAKILYTDWQDRASNSLQNLVSNSPTFLEDIKEVRADKHLSSNEKSLLIINKYGSYSLRFAATELVAYYIETDNINPQVMRPPVIAVSTKENIAGPSFAHNNGKTLKVMLDNEMTKHPNNWVYLVIDPECTKTDMQEWVNNNWDWFLQERLDATKPAQFKRVGTNSYTERDQVIHEHIRIQGKPAKDIAGAYNITPEYARKIAQREAQKLKKSHDK